MARIRNWLHDSLQMEQRNQDGSMVPNWSMSDLSNENLVLQKLLTSDVRLSARVAFVWPKTVIVDETLSSKSHEQKSFQEVRCSQFCDKFN